MEIGYYAVFDYEEENTYGISISFPDLPGCLSSAFTEKHGLLMAKEVLELFTYDMYVYQLPKPSSLDELSLKDNEKAFFISYRTEDVDISAYVLHDDDDDDDEDLLSNSNE